MNFDPLDLVEANLALLQEAARLEQPSPALLMTIATWGRGADPEMLQALQPYRHGVGFNGSIVARVPEALALQWLPEKARQDYRSGEGTTRVYSAVFKDWVLHEL